jgi:hypothetical protein
MMQELTDKELSYKLSEHGQMHPTFVDFLKDMLDQQDNDLRRIEQMKVRAEA